MSNDHFKIVSSSGFKAVITPVEFLREATLKARISINGFGFSYETFPVTLRSMDFKLTGSKFISPVARRYSVSGVPSGAILTWNLAPNLEVVEKKDNYVVIRDKSDKNTFNDLWIEANLNSQGNVTSRRMNLKRARVERVELECLQNKVVDVNGERKRRFIYQANVFPQDIPSEEFNICWSTYAYKKVGRFGIDLVRLDDRTHLSACYTGTSGDITTFPPMKLNRLGGYEVVRPDEYDMYWPTPSSIVSYVPSCQVGDSIFGYVRATLKDGYNNSIVVKASLWNYYVTMVHTAPNPCNTILTVSLGGPANELNGRSRLAYESVVVSLHDDHGLVRSVEADSSQPEIRMDVSDLPNGFYYLNILKRGELIDRQVVLVKH